MSHMIQIAGGVVYNPKYGIAVVNQNHNSWSLPKGHVEEGETHLEAAIREIYEETGIPKEALLFGKALGSYDRERIARNMADLPEMRTITLFLFTTEQETLSPLDPENPEAKWVPIEEVASVLTHTKDKEYFASIKSEIIQ